MYSLFPLPIYTFLKIASKNGGISNKGLLNMLPWLMKIVAFEPLRWIELAAHHKRISEYKISEQPLFILGYYRSGTTYLQQLFMQDDRFGYTSAFQMLFPEIVLSCEKWLTPALELISRNFKIQNHIHRIPFSFNSPGEDDVAMTSALFETGAQWGQFFPTSMQTYFKQFTMFEENADQLEKWKRDYLLFLKKISLANHHKQLVLKSPPNTARIKVILSLFPGAKFVFIHRNPYDVYASNKRLWEVVEKHYMLGKPIKTGYSDLILNGFTESIQKYLADKEMLQAGQLVEIRYQDFIADPLFNMRKIYSSLNLPDIQNCEDKMSGYIEKQKSYTTQNHQLSLAETKMIAAKWKTFFKQWDYPI